MRFHVVGEDFMHASMRSGEMTLGNHVLMFMTVPLFWALGRIVIVLGLRFESTVLALATAYLGGIVFCFG